MKYGGTNKWTPPRESRGVTRFSLNVEISRLARTGRPNPSRETKFSGAKGHREIFIFPVQLTPRRIGNLTRLILYSAIHCNVKRVERDA